MYSDEHNNDSETPRELAKLECVIDRLTGTDGCPWDRVQTPSSLTEYLIEECFELVEAIRFGKPDEVREELGDLLFLIVFMGKLAQKNGDFSLADAIAETTGKMIRRHPHVFGNTKFANLEDLLDNWEQIKRKEKTDKAAGTGVYANLPRSLPPLTKAYRIHSKAARAGFTWPEDEEVEQQVEAEWLELLDALAQGDEKAIFHEFGDHLFSLVELGRRKGIKSAEALDAATERFLDRFSRMEALAAKRGLDFSRLSLDEKDELWEEIKSEEANS